MFLLLFGYFEGAFSVFSIFYVMLMRTWISTITIGHVSLIHFLFSFFELLYMFNKTWKL